MKRKETRFYSRMDEDFIESREQDFRLPDHYEYIRTDLRSRLLSGISYAFGLLFYCMYCVPFLHVRIKNAGALRRQTGGAFVYANHTQPIGDVFNPAAACLPRRIYTVVSAANLGIPVIGRILPYLGALPLPSETPDFVRFTKAVGARAQSGNNVVIYPEAHVWEYYTGIRPFPETAFKYPILFDRPAYCLTTTYQSRGHGRKPRAVIYADGPFFPDESLPRFRRAADLRDRVFAQMRKRSELSDCEYIKYRKRDGA